VTSSFAGSDEPAIWPAALLDLGLGAPRNHRDHLSRVTFNPLKHIYPMGTIVLPALLLFLRSPFLFGYAKPVPVNFVGTVTNEIIGMILWITGHT
jgi:Zn-dependent protease